MKSFIVLLLIHWFLVACSFNLGLIRGLQRSIYKFEGVGCTTESIPSQNTKSLSPLQLRLESDMKLAMRSKEKERVTVIRSIRAAIQKTEIDERVAMDDDKIIGYA